MVIATHYQDRVKNKGRERMYLLREQERLPRVDNARAACGKNKACIARGMARRGQGREDQQELTCLPRDISKFLGTREKVRLALHQRSLFTRSQSSNFMLRIMEIDRGNLSRVQI